MEYSFLLFLFALLGADDCGTDAFVTALLYAKEDVMLTKDGGDELFVDWFGEFHCLFDLPLELLVLHSFWGKEMAEGIDVLL